MTQIEYKKMRMERRKKNREQMERAKSAGFIYPADLVYFWEFMQEKNMGIRYCLGMVYQLGFVDAQKQGPRYTITQAGEDYIKRMEAEQHGKDDPATL